MPLLRLRGQGAARGAGRRRRARPDRARPDLHALVPARAAHAVQGHLRAAAGACADRRARQRSRCGRYWQLRISRTPTTPSARPPQRSRDRRGAARRCCSTPRASGCASDVPVGAYLSGGLDSSIVDRRDRSSIMPDRLRTFSVTFEAAEFDESAFQQEMVRALGTEHSSIAVHAPPTSAALFPGRGPRTPSGRSCAPRRRRCSCCRGSCASSGFKVVLTGEGADEVFAGYDIFKEAKIRRFCARQPRLALAAAAAAAALSLSAAACRASRRAISKRSSRAGARRARRSAVLAPAALPHDGRRQDVLLRRAARGARRLRRARRAARAACRPSSRAGIRCRRRSTSKPRYLLPGYILSSQGDRVAMAHAVEGRFPFLDHRVVEFAARIPPRLKMQGPAREAHPARGACAICCRRRSATAPKQPYRAPDSQSFVGAERAGLRRASCLSAPAIAAPGYFDPRAVEKLVAKCRSQRPSSASATTWRSSASCRPSSGIASSSPAPQTPSVAAASAVA